MPATRGRSSGGRLAEVKNLTDGEHVRYIQPHQFAYDASEGRWKPYRHLAYLGGIFARELWGPRRGARIVVSMPPRAGKSEAISRRIPEWLLYWNPETRIILTSYEADFAAEWGRKVRNDLLERPDFFGVKIRDDSAAADRWHTTAGGGMVTAGVGGAITGRGGDCLPAGTMIATEDGPMDIALLARSGYLPRVAAFDHGTNSVVWRRILATRTVVVDGLLEIETCSGRKVRATREHRFYDRERGYRSASLLRPGDGLVAIQVKSEQGVRDLREPEGGTRGDLSGVLQQGQEDLGHHEVRILRQGVREDALRGGESGKARPDRRLLLPGMFQKTPRREEREAVRILRQPHAGQASEQVLLAGVQAVICGSLQDHPVSSRLPGVRGTVQPVPRETGVLLDEVREQEAREGNARAGKLKLQGRHLLHNPVSWNAVGHSGAGRSEVRCVRDDREPCGSPRGQEQGQQRAEEPCGVVQFLPYHAPQVEDDAVSVVREVRGGRVEVYDLQVEGTSNFFANGLLVHNCLIIDDYCKNWEQAMSETYRKRTIEWFDSTLYTRAEPGASIVVLATRWHEADLIGYLLNEHADPWLEVRLPALAEENDPLGRPVGAALCPERYDEAALLRIKAAVAPMVWDGLYQQRPAPQDGGLFKRGMFRRFRLHDAGETRTLELLAEDGPKVYRMEDCKVFQTCDVAGSLKAHADFFVLGTWALCPGGELALLDIFRDRLEGPDQPALLMRKFAEWRPMVQAIEAKSMGLTLYQSMVRSGLPILELNPGTRDKYTRALSMAPRYHAGMVYHREGAPWLDELEKELVAFPNAAHDDQTDVVSYAGDVVEWVLTGRDPNGGGVYVID